MSTILITGANRGIGLELTKRYAAEGWTVIACCRKPKDAKALIAVKGDIDIRALDVAKPASIAKLKAALGNRPIDVLLNNAGIYGQRGGFGKTDPKDFMATFQVNTLAPLLVSEALLGNLLKGGMKKIASITSKMGSIGDGPGGGGYAYRASKTALNMVMANAAAELKGKGIATVLLHPGWVQTDMGGRNAPVKKEESAAGIMKVIAALTPATSGRFFNYDGSPLPW
ncbi:SDR family oxidoreductase [Dongia sp.]|uniref:SDR family oxidoreductase n=1 Tax=Dongia sp. TaxID=1977262 RepID=UPI0035AE6B7D